MRTMAPAGGTSPTPPDDGDLVTGLAEQVRETRRLVRGEDDPGAIGPPVLDRLRDPARPAGRQDRLAPAERVARRQPAAGHRGIFGRDGFPGELERPRCDEAALPVARRQIGRRPVLGELARGDELGAALIGLAPQECGRLGDVAGLVEDEQGPGVDVVEAGRRGEVGGPDLGRIADREGAARLGLPIGSRGQRFGVEPFEVAGESLR